MGFLDDVIDNKLVEKYTEENVVQEKKGKAGRPKLDEYVKLQRRVYRAYISFKEAESVFEHNAKARTKGLPKGTKVPLDEKMKTYQRRAKNTAKKLREEVLAMDQYEREIGIAPIDIEEIIAKGDPDVVNEDLSFKAGRPAVDELGAMDARVRYFDRKIAEVAQEKDLEGAELEEKLSHQGRGRPWQQPSARRRQFEINRDVMISRIEEKEDELTGLAKVERELKKSRDIVRLLKKEIKDTRLDKSIATDQVEKILLRLSEQYKKADAESKNLAKLVKVAAHKQSIEDEISSKEAQVEELELISDQDKQFEINGLKREMKELQEKLIRL